MHDQPDGTEQPEAVDETGGNEVPQPDAPQPPAHEIQHQDGLPGVFLGASGQAPQYGILGEDGLGGTVALDLNETHTISLFGVQGGGKSYTLGSIIEAASIPSPPVSLLPHPLATIVFHYSPTLDYEPEFTSMASPNLDPSQVQVLAERYGASPRRLTEFVLLVPADQLVHGRRSILN